MGTLTALLLATPIFGFALNPPAIQALPASAVPVAQLESSVDLDVQGDTAEAETKGPSAAPVDPSTYREQLKKRAKLAKIHRTLGITTWAAMVVAVAAGTVQYRNLYGGGGVGDNPCVNNKAWPNQDQCSGAPLGHAIPGFVTGALYFTTMGLAMAMPDPDHAAVGKSKYAKTVRTHKALRWVHLTGMIAQMVTGIILANPRLGLDRANDYDTMKKLSGFHLGAGLVTLGAMTWAGTIMLF